MHCIRLNRLSPWSASVYSGPAHSHCLYPQVLVGVVIKIGVQFSGIDAIFYYSTLMFRHANVADPQLSTFLLSLVNVAMTFIALTIMDKAGRRPLLMCTWVGMCCGFFTIYLTSTLGDVFGFFPTLMSNAQASPRPERRACPEQ